MKIDLESLSVLEVELQGRFRREWRALRRFGEFCDRRALILPKGRKKSAEEKAVRSDFVHFARPLRVTLAGLRAIQLARRTMLAMNELEAKYGAKVSK